MIEEWKVDALRPVIDYINYAGKLLSTKVRECMLRVCVCVCS